MTDTETQTYTASRGFAITLAGFHSGLIAGGMTPADAITLTTDYLFTLMQQARESGRQQGLLMFGGSQN